AAGRGERELDVDLALAVLALFQAEVVDQAQLDHVHRDLRVEHGAQLVPGQLLHVGVGGVGRHLDRRRRLLAQRVGVLARDAEQVAFHVHREAAAQRLRDVADLAGGQAHRFALRHHHRIAVAQQGEGFAAQTETAHATANPSSRMGTARRPVVYYAALQRGPPAPDQVGPTICKPRHTRAWRRPAAVTGYDRRFACRTDACPV